MPIAIVVRPFGRKPYLKKKNDPPPQSEGSSKIISKTALLLLDKAFHRDTLITPESYHETARW